MKLPFTLRKPMAAPLVRQTNTAADSSTGATELPAKDGALQALGKGAHKKGKKGKKKRIIAAVLVIAIAGGIAAYLQLTKKDDTAKNYTEETVKKHDIQDVLSATGTLEPLNQYNVTASVKGDVQQCNFEEGDVVKKDQVLYVVDSSDVQDNISKSKISVEQSRLSYEEQLENMADLKVAAKKTGVITDVKVEKGDKVSSGAVIATIRDSSTMTITLPFNSADAKKFYVGEAATVSLDSTFETLSGTVTEIDGADSVLSGNQLVRYVKIRVKNPGALSSSSSGAAKINGIACNGGASFAYNEEASITAETSGTVTWVASKGTTVSGSTTVAKLASTEVQNSLKNSQLSLKNSQMSLQSTVESLEDYQIKAPIAGTIVTKNTKVGDTLDNTNGNTTLAVIYDMSKLTFDIALDELDVNQVSVGQKVNITVDALDGKEFTGYITKVSVAGTTENGATTYPVTVQIDNPPSELYPGMNVDASIIVNEATDVIAVPVAAVQRGDTVYVKDAAGETGSSGDSTKPEAETDGATLPNGAAEPAETSASDEKQSSGSSASSRKTSGSSEKTSGNKSGGAASEIPEGYHAVKVETGISDDDYIEIKSGISEGDTVYVPQVARSSSSSDSEKDMMMMGGGGMGGAPSGGGGGMPSGGGMPG